MKTELNSNAYKDTMPRLLIIGSPNEQAILKDLKASFEIGFAKRITSESSDLAVAFLLKSKDACLRYIEDIKQKNPLVPIIAVVRSDDAKSALEASRCGASEIMIHPITSEQLKRAYERLKFSTNEQGAVCEQVITASGARKSFITRSARLIRTLEIARKAAETDATVLISGESGTGKELLAAYIHTKSTRKDNPFVAVNCAALPMELAESELFGHERGAFTGAISQRKGKFELAHTGSLLLDEISELDARLQAKLLRVLEDKLIWRVGGSKPINVDVRIIAITNSDLAKRVLDGKFREDLFYRLDVISIEILPLRERKEDIPLLAEHFLNVFCQRYKRPKMTISDEAMKMLESHCWQGNVRELQNTIERIALLCESSIIEPKHIILEKSCPDRKFKEGFDVPLNLEELERMAIKRALELCCGNRTSAAKLLGITVRTLRNKLSRYREIFSYCSNTFREPIKGELPAEYRVHVVQ